MLYPFPLKTSTIKRLNDTKYISICCKVAQDECEVTLIPSMSFSSPHLVALARSLSLSLSLLSHFFWHQRSCFQSRVSNWSWPPLTHRIDAKHLLNYKNSSVDVCFSLFLPSFSSFCPRPAGSARFPPGAGPAFSNTSNTKGDGPRGHPSCLMRIYHIFRLVVCILFSTYKLAKTKWDRVWNAKAKGESEVRKRWKEQKERGVC